MDLYLVRHAIAEERDAERWPDDAARPLTSRGRSRFRRAAHGLAEAVPAPGVLLSSPYERSWATAELLEREAAWPAPRALPALAPGTAPHELLETVLAEAGDAAVVALVGHEPDLHRLASYLLTGSPAALVMEWHKGGVACVRWDGPPRAGAATLAWQLPPRILRRLGR